MADILNGDNTIPKKCISISKKFIRAINKHGTMINFMVLKDTVPQNNYELLYGQREQATDKDIQIKVLFTLNPPEDTYKDMHFETRGNAIMTFMAYSMQLVGLIGNTSKDYLDIPKMLTGNHLRYGNDYYRIDEVKQSSIYMGFPLCQDCSLTFIETKE